MSNAPNESEMWSRPEPEMRAKADAAMKELYGEGFEGRPGLRVSGNDYTNPVSPQGSSRVGGRVGRVGEARPDENVHTFHGEKGTPAYQSHDSVRVDATKDPYDMASYFPEIEQQTKQEIVRERTGTPSGNRFITCRMRR